jgi:hypothetical protein
MEVGGELHALAAFPQGRSHGYSLDKVEKAKSLCLTNQALRHEDVWGSECIDPRILNLGTSWR